MLRRFGLQALTASCMLAGALSLRADEPLYVPGSLPPTATGPQRGEQFAPATALLPDGSSYGAIQPATHCTSCSFDSYGYYDEAQQHHQRIGERYRKKFGGGGEGCDTCGAADTGGQGFLRAWAAKHGGFSEDPSRAQNRTNDDAYNDFQCANCYGRWNFEKRLFYAYDYGKSLGLATRAAYDNDHGAQVGVELLPWVLTDGSFHYSRWGLMTLFDYRNYQGNRQFTLESRAAQLKGISSFLTVNDAVTYSWVLGPMYRVDFEVCGIRMSPNVMAGMAFDWTSVHTREPVGTELRRIGEFKHAGFDAGGYIRWMWDFAICDSINIGVGMDFKFTPTDVMVDHDDMRKHIGVIVALNHEF